MATDAPYPPLMSPRSPSYARAREELRHPSPTGDPEVVALLSQLDEAEQNASKACFQAAARLSDRMLADRVRGDAETHHARSESLGELIAALGGSGPRPEECRQILTRGPEAIESARSDEESVQALKILRDELTKAYEETTRSPNLDDAQRASIARLAPTATG